MKSPHKAVLAVLAVLTASVLAASGATAAAAPVTNDTNSREEAQLQKLYKQAVTEGGNLVVYAGGDKPGQADYLRDAFVKKFPKIRSRCFRPLKRPLDVERRAGIDSLCS